MTPATDSPAFQPSPLSEVLTGIANRWDQPRISVADLMAALGERGLIGLLMILAIINVIPNIPGTSAVLGLPMLYLSWQMMRGGIPWLPRFLAMRSFDTDQFRALIIRAMPLLNKVERLLRSRLNFVGSPLGLKVLGGVCLLLSVMLVLPIPFGNLLPAAAIAIITLGALERDGVWIIGGVLFGTATAVFLSSAILLLTRALMRLVELGL